MGVEAIHESPLLDCPIEAGNDRRKQGFSRSRRDKIPLSPPLKKGDRGMGKADLNGRKVMGHFLTLNLMYTG